MEWAEVDDPYIRARYQVLNFVRFCELAVKSCKRLKSIRLTTGTGDGRSRSEVSAWLAELQCDKYGYLGSRRLKIDYFFSTVKPAYMYRSPLVLATIVKQWPLIFLVCIGTVQLGLRGATVVRGGCLKRWIGFTVPSSIAALYACFGVSMLRNNL